MIAASQKQQWCAPLHAAENSRDCGEDNRQCGPNCAADCPATEALYLTDMPQGDQSIFGDQVQFQNTAVIPAGMTSPIAAHMFFHDCTADVHVASKVMIYFC